MYVRDQASLGTLKELERREKDATRSKRLRIVILAMQGWTAPAIGMAMAEKGRGDVPWVFCNSKGGPLRRTHFHKNVFKPLLKKAGLPDIRFHDLRHTSATLLLSAGVHPKVVQERLGHSQIRVTLDTYSHVLPTMQREAASKMNDLLIDHARRAWVWLAPQSGAVT